MSVFENTWAYSSNVEYTPVSTVNHATRILWTLAATLTGNTGGLTLGLWTLVGSSDGVTAGHDSTDRWSLASYDATKFVYASGASAHSWIVLQSPSINGNPWYVIFTCNTTGTDFAYLISKTAPTGGTTTATPTSTDTWCPGSNTPGSTSFTTGTYSTGATTKFRTTIGLTSGGEWYFLQATAGTRVVRLFLTFRALSNYDANDLAPVWAVYDNAVTGVLRGQMSGITVDGITFYNWSRKAVDLTNTGYRNFVGCLTVYNPSEADFQNPQSALQEYNGGYGEYPVLILHGLNVSSITDIRGRVSDFSVCPYARINLPEGSVSLTNDVIDSVKVGSLWLPMNTYLDLT